MERLWAPWRMGYVSKAGEGECIFCVKPKESSDEKNYIVKRGKYCFSMLNIYPYNNGHLMVAPYRHVPDLLDLREEEIVEMMQMLRELEAKLKKLLKPDGFNIGINIGRAAGAGFEGHIHIVPRWNGDTNFMPVLSDTKVISQSLEELYKLLKDE
jgi:ATP adenylyltransferase